MKAILFTFLLILSILLLSSSASARILAQNGDKLQVSPPYFTRPTHDPKRPVPFPLSCSSYKRNCHMSRPPPCNPYSRSCTSSPSDEKQFTP